MSKGLEAWQVLELGGGVAAGYAGKLLANLGARVVKLEAPEGDPTRRRGPFPRNQPHPERSGTFIALNTNKRSVVADLHTESGRQTLHSLAGRTHLLLHDLPPGEMAAQGLEFEGLRRNNPALVMLSLTPFGLSGPHKDYSASDLTLIHGGGWGWLCPGKSQRADQPPIKPFGQHVLVQAGIHGVVAALAALRAARLSGVGEHIDLSMQQVVGCLLGRHFGVHAYTGKPDSRLSPSLYEPMSFYPCRDGAVFIIAPEEAQYERLLELMGHPSWGAEPRFKGKENRGANQEPLKALISQWTAGKTVDEVFHGCQQQRVGAAPVYSHAQLEGHPHLKLRGFFRQLRQPALGTTTLPGAPYLLQQDWWKAPTPAPELGEANRDKENVFNALKAILPAPENSGAEEVPALPLAGVRVLDFSWIWAGPHCTLLLAMLGAEVIKVESARRLDLSRRANLYASGLEPGVNRSGYFNTVNQGKRSLTVNLAHPDGVQLLLELAGQCDVVVSNFGTGVMERLGLGTAALQKARRDLIICAISAFGQTGPCREYVGYGPLISPLGGVTAHTGYSDGAPQDVGTAYGDPNGGAHAAVAILAALLARDSFGGGQVIDLSMWEAMINTGFEGWMRHAVGLPPLPRGGNHDPADAPHNCFPCAGEDHWLAISVHSDAQWQSLCRALGQPGWAGEPRFSTASARKRHEADLDALIAETTRGRDHWELTGTLQNAGVCAYPSLNGADLLENPQLAARQFFNTPHHQEVGLRPHPGTPWNFLKKPLPPMKAAPLLGADTDSILRTLLDLSEQEIQHLRSLDAIE